MTSALLTPSGVKLFGHEVEDLEIDASKAVGGDGANRFLKAQLDAPKARLARIYAFSYEGEFYYMARPAVFLVHGEGTKLTDDSDVARALQSPEKSGIAAASFQFANKISAWDYDKGDFTLRLDIFGGTFEEVLLAPEFAAYDDGGPYGGGPVGGGKVGGGKVGGGKVGGGKVGGGKVGGGKVGGF